MSQINMPAFEYAFIMTIIALTNLSPIDVDTKRVNVETAFERVLHLKYGFPS